MFFGFFECFSVLFKHKNEKQSHSRIKRLCFNNGEKFLMNFVPGFKKIVVRESFKIMFLGIIDT